MKRPVAEKKRHKTDTSASEDDTDEWGVNSV